MGKKGTCGRHARLVLCVTVIKQGGRDDLQDTDVGEQAGE